MLEINRQLYLNPAIREGYRLGKVPLKLSQFDKVRNAIWSIVFSMTHEMTCRAAVPDKLAVI